MAQNTNRERIIQLLTHGVKNFATLSEAKERVTRRDIITPVLIALGWPQSSGDSTHLTLDYDDSIDGGQYVDYKAEVHGNAYLLVEAKSVSTDLDKKVAKQNVDGRESPVEQIERYSYKNPPLACVTNGLEWRMYLPQRPGDDWIDRHFLTIALGQDSDENAIVDAAEKLILYLAAPSTDSDGETAPDKAVAEHKRRRHVAKVLAEILPEMDFIGLIRAEFASARQIEALSDEDLVRLLIEHLSHLETTSTSTLSQPDATKQRAAATSITEVSWGSASYSAKSNFEALKWAAEHAHRTWPNEFADRVKGLNGFLTCEMKKRNGWKAKGYRNEQVGSTSFYVLGAANTIDMCRRLRLLHDAFDENSTQSFEYVVTDADGNIVSDPASRS